MSKQYHYEWLTTYLPSQPTVVCLHGFTGTLNTFKSLAFSDKYNYLGIDLIGHGQSESYVHPENYRMEQVVEALRHLLVELAIPSYYLLGYSMGGRVALAWALNDERVQGVILENASPGLLTMEERVERQLKDERLAKRLLTEPLEAFVDFWQDLALFDTQKELSSAIQTKVRQERLSQQNYGLAMSLLMMGTGQQASYWEALEHTEQAMLYVTGTVDHKFQQIGQQMQDRYPNMQLVALDGGHCVHLENPVAFVSTVEQWLEEQMR